MTTARQTATHRDRPLSICLNALRPPLSSTVGPVSHAEGAIARRLPRGGVESDEGGEELFDFRQDDGIVKGKLISRRIRPPKRLRMASHRCR